MVVDVILNLCMLCFFCFQSITNCDGSDSEDYDLDADLQEVQKDTDQNSSVKSSPADVMQSSMPVRKVSELKNNNSSSVTAKLQGLLEKINPITLRQTKARADDGNDMHEEDNLEDTQVGDGSQFPGKESSKAKPQTTADEDNSDSDSDEDMKVQYRSDMLKQAMSDFYKGQSTVSFLRKFIYANGKWSIILIHSCNILFAWMYLKVVWQLVGWYRRKF